MKFKFLIFTLSVFMIGLIVIDNVQSQGVGPGPIISDNTDVTPGYYYTFGTRDEGSNYSNVGDVYRWYNIDYQYLKNYDTGDYQSFDEPKAFLPYHTKFFRKKVKVDFYATGQLDATRADSFKGHVACMGKAESTAGWTIYFGDVNDKTIYQKGGQDATGIVSCSASRYYVVDEPQTITYSVTAYGAAVSEHGGGAGGGASLPTIGGFQMNYTAGSVTAPTGFPGVVSESTSSFTIDIRAKDEFPTGTKCAVPNIGLYGTHWAPLCPADADAGQSYEVPGTHYHSYVCYGNGCLADRFNLYISIENDLNLAKVDLFPSVFFTRAVWFVSYAET